MAKRGENIYKRKDGRYEGRYVRGHSVEGKTLFGYIYAYTYAEVKQSLTLAKAASKQAEPVRFIGKGTLGEFLLWWLKNVMRERVKASTYAQYQERIIHHIIPALGGVAVCKLSTEQVQEFVNVLSGKGLAASTTINIARLLRSAMQKAVELHVASVNPCDDVTLPNFEIKTRRALDRTEQVQLEQMAANAGKNVDIGVFLALYGGLRIGELCALRWRDFDLFSGTLTVRSTLQRIRNFEGGAAKTVLAESAPKSKRSMRQIPLPADVADKLRRYGKDAFGDNFILTDSIKPLEPRTLRARFDKIANNAGLSIPFHSLRHTYAARCLEHNFDIQTLSELLGHATANTTLTVYAHSVLEHKRLLTSRLCILSKIYEPSNEPSFASTAHKIKPCAASVSM